jgi:hypothetical protein
MESSTLQRNLKKAGKLEYKIIQEELNERRNARTGNDFQEESS